MTLNTTFGFDEYSIITNIHAAKIHILKTFDENGSVIFPYSKDGDCVIIHIARSNQVGMMPFGGQCGDVVVGVVYGGFFHFDSTSRFYPSYVGEKLNLSDRHAEMVSEVLNAIFDELL